MTLSFSLESASTMLAYWASEGFGWAISPTAAYFAENIESGNIEFWAAGIDGRIVGELYLVRKTEDPDFADGDARCYLCAFRTTPALRGHGIGSRLMTHVLARAAALGFREVTIGVGEDEPRNIALYRRFGFDRTVKIAEYDPCDRLPDGRPCPDRFLLLAKTLEPGQEG